MFKHFFENKDFVVLIDLMAQKYGKTPHEIMQMDLFEFSLNVTIMGVSAIRQVEKTKEAENAGKDGANWARLGVERTIKVKNKETGEELKLGDSK